MELQGQRYLGEKVVREKEYRSAMAEGRLREEAQRGTTMDGEDCDDSAVFRKTAEIVGTVYYDAVAVKVKLQASSTASINSCLVIREL